MTLRPAAAAPVHLSRSAGEVGSQSEPGEGAGRKEQLT